MRFALAAAASIAVVGGVGVIQLGDFPPGDVQAPSRIVTAQLKLVMPNDTEVRIDGALAQRTPGNVAIELRPGRHRISFRHPQLGSVDHIVELAPGGVRTLEPIFASRAEID
jgi:hypothetical protein